MIDASLVGPPYRFSNRSKEVLSTVHPDLQRVVNRAIEISQQDFTVFEGIRTLERQKRLVNQGVSKTLNSKHLTGRAVDLVPYGEGKLDFNDWEKFYPIAEAMQQASRELQIPIRWGGHWQELNQGNKPLRELREEYIQQRRAQGKRVFLDAPHFELL